MKNKILPIVVVLLIVVGISALWKNNDKNKNDEWHYSDGSSIVCRVNGCGNNPVYSNWDDRFCKEHLNKSENHSEQYDASVAKKKINTKKALTKEEADALRGTGYHGTKPNSFAESNALKAAMVTCKNCGMHSDNGSNSLCDECQYNKEYGFD